jgi:hypothetical protein
MSADFGIVHALWNHAADAGALLDRVAGEVGIDHVTVPVVTGELEEFRLARATGQPYFHTEGGWHFPPTTKTYAAAGVRPIKARWFGTTDALARLREHTQRLGVGLIARIDLCAVRALVESEPHLAQRNAWGQEVFTAGPCVNNPQLRELLRATLENLRLVEPAAFQLIDWLPDQTDHGDLPHWGHYLLAHPLTRVCFCAPCRDIAERAGVDSDAAARSVRVQIERAWELADVQGTGADDPVVQAYLEARAVDCGNWLRRTAAADAERRYQLVRAPGSAWPVAPDGLIQRIIRLPRSFGESPERWLDQDCVIQGDGWSFFAWSSVCRDAATLVRVVTKASRRGVRFTDFEGLDEAPAEAITWLKQAVRFARRG